MANSLSVEKDWVTVICSGSSSLLANTNAVLKRIDLTSKILAPTAMGIVMAFFGIFWGAALIGIWNIGSVIPEYLLLSWTYNSFPQLKSKEHTSTSHEKVSYCALLFQQIASLKNGWHIYFQQSCLCASLALAMIYCTVLSFGSIMTGYVYARGMNESYLGIFIMCILPYF